MHGTCFGSCMSFSVKSWRIVCCMPLANAKSPSILSTTAMQLRSFTFHDGIQLSFERGQGCTMLSDVPFYWLQRLSSCNCI